MTSSNEHQKKMNSVLSNQMQTSKMKKIIRNKQKSIDISSLNQNIENFCFEIEQNSDSTENSNYKSISNIKNIDKKENKKCLNEIITKSIIKNNNKKYIIIPTIKKFLNSNEKIGITKNKIRTKNNNTKCNNGKSKIEEKKNYKVKSLSTNDNKSATNLTYNNIKYENPEFNTNQLSLISKLDEYKIENKKIKKNIITQQVLIIDMKKEIENLIKEKENLVSQNSELISKIEKKRENSLNLNDTNNNYNNLLSKYNELKNFDDKQKNDFINNKKELKLIKTQNEDLIEENSFLLKEYVKLKKEMEKNKDNNELILKNNELKETIKNQKIEIEAINKILKDKNFEILDFTKEIQKIKENLLSQNLITSSNILSENDNINKNIDQTYELIKEISIKLKKNNNNNIKTKNKNSNDLIINSLKDFLFQVNTKNNGNIQTIDKLKNINEFINIILVKIEFIMDNNLHKEKIKEEFNLNSKRNNSLSPSSNGQKNILTNDNNEKIDCILKERSLENINTKYKKIKQYIYQGNDKNKNSYFNFVLDKKEFQRKNNKINTKVCELTDLINKNKTKASLTNNIKKSKIAVSNDNNISTNALTNKKKFLFILRNNTFNETNLKIKSNNSTIGKDYNYHLTSRNESNNTLNNSKNNNYFFRNKFHKLDIFHNYNRRNKISCDGVFLNENFCGISSPNTIQNSHTIESNIIKNNILAISSFGKIIDQKPLSTLETINSKKKSWQKINLNPKKLCKDLIKRDINELVKEVIRPKFVKNNSVNEQNIFSENKREISAVNRIKRVKSPFDSNKIHKNKSFLY